MLWYQIWSSSRCYLYCKSLLLSYLLAYKWFLGPWRPKSYCMCNWTWSLLSDWDVPARTHLALHTQWWAHCANTQIRLHPRSPHTHAGTLSLFFPTSHNLFIIYKNKQYQRKKGRTKHRKGELDDNNDIYYSHDDHVIDWNINFLQTVPHTVWIINK